MKINYFSVRQGADVDPKRNDVHGRSIRRFLHLWLSRSFNTICFPLKILRENYFSFLLGVTIVPWKTENKTYPKFSGETKLHYGNVKVADTEKTELCEPHIKRAPSII